MEVNVNKLSLQQHVFPNEAAFASDRQTAIVIGAGFAGLFSARVLSKYFKKVLIVDKDPLPTEAPALRKGQPHAAHQHLLLVKGRELLKRYFPEFESALDRYNVSSLDYGRDVILQLEEGDLPRYETGLSLRPCRRVLLDFILLQAVKGLENVEFSEPCRVSGLLSKKQGGVPRVTGIRLATHQTVLADLVVDASGRGSKLGQWLDSMGIAAPPTMRVDAKAGYASRSYSLSDKEADALGFSGLDIAPHAPRSPRAAGLWKLEGNEWLLTLIGMNACYPANDEEGFLNFAKQLNSAPLNRFLSLATPTDDIVIHRATSNVWRQYHKQGLPNGLLAIGDACCAYNPLHGQGLSVVAQVMERLDAALQKKPTEQKSWQAWFHKRSAFIYQQAWYLSLTEDIAWPNTQTEGLRNRFLLKLAHGYGQLFLRAAQKHPALVKLGLDVTNMVRNPLVLLAPSVFFKVMAQLGRSPVKHLDMPSACKQDMQIHSKYVDRLDVYQNEWGVQSSSYFGHQSGCRYFELKDIGYAAFREVRLGFRKLNVMPCDPICPPQMLPRFLRAMEAFTGNKHLLLGVSEGCKNQLSKQGYRFSQLGREFQYPIKRFKVAGKAKKYLRWAANFGERGFQVLEQKWSEVDQARVLEISKRWRKTKTFSWRELELLTRPPVFAEEGGVRKFYCYLNGVMVGYVFFDPFYEAGKLKGYCANILRSDPRVKPSGFLDYVILQAIEMFRAEGVEVISLGMAPLDSIKQEPGDEASVRKLAQGIYNQGAWLYAFRSLAYHKRRYRLDEYPWYICYQDLNVVSAAYATARACRVL
jgi:2-polyprenyl-6-methoxyphenol hydroxylase-like FAD-dependent oxidoreductase